MFGFYVRASNNQGECIPKSVALSDSPAHRLEYGNKMTVSCAVEVSTLDEFEAECISETARTDLKIFDQFLS